MGFHDGKGCVRFVNNPMKVAIVMPLAEQRGGAELMLIHLLQANRCSGEVDYRIAFLEDGPLVGEAAARGYPAQVFPAGRLRQGHRYLSALIRLGRWMRREKADAVMSWMAKAHLYAGPAAWSAGIPAVWWQHGMPEGGRLDRLTVRLPAQAVFCCSHTVRAVQERMRPARSMQVINPAVDLGRFDASRLPSVPEARRSLDLPTDRPVIGMVARLQRWKGVHVFLEAAAHLARTHPEAVFVVVGGTHALEPGYADVLARHVRDGGLGSRVRLVGYQLDTALWMQAMDVVAHASIEPEPFGMVVIEAMALGKLVIASRAGGPLEIVEDGVDGLLTEPGDANALAAAMERGLADTPVNRAMRAAARSKASRYGTDPLAQNVACRLRESVTQWQSKRESKPA